MSGIPQHHQRARRYVAWVKRHSWAIIVGHLLALAGAVYLVAYRLPLLADFSYLLPQDAPAVQDLRKLEARVKTTDTILAVIDAPSPEVRARAVTELAAGIRAISPELVERVEEDDSATRAYWRAHRALFVPLDDLTKGRDALARHLKAAKLAANPLYVDLDDTPAESPEDRKQLDDLRAKKHEAEAKLDRSSNVSLDGKIAMIQIQTAFRATDAARGHKLVGALSALGDRVMAESPGLRIGFTGGNVHAVAEHDAILDGMLLSSIVTALLVALVLALYFRSATLLVLLITTLVIATAAAFGAAALTVGHLNAATAFLGAIIAGNGVNYGILLIARYLEERRRLDVDAAMAAAIAGTLRPTAVASLAASIAYGSLAATSFKGFADFAIIGAIGMALCWIASYVLLPALMVRFGRDTRIHHGDPLVGSLLVRVIGFRRAGVVVAVALGLGAAACAIVTGYIARDPFEYDMKKLRSEGSAAVAARSWMELSDKTFGRGFAGRTYMAADRLDQVRPIVDALHARDQGVPPAQQTIGEVSSVLDVIPDQQPEKLAVLGEIRALLDDDALEALDDKERADLAELRPPDHLEPITEASLPANVRDLLTEKDGRFGYLIAIRPAARLDEWNGHDLIRFSDAVRELRLRNGETVTTSGASVVFADIIGSIERDGPIVTAIGAAGLVIMVVLLVGRNRRAVAVLVATGAGSLLMVAVCAVLGLKVNFLDFVALPITLGLGVDYAINVAHRYDEAELRDPIATLRTSGSAVFVCSLTTMIGYGSLLVSENLAIKGFGAASLIGEVSCVLTALVLVPALLAVGDHQLRERRRGDRETALTA